MTHFCFIFPKSPINKMHLSHLHFFLLYLIHLANLTLTDDGGLIFVQDNVDVETTSDDLIHAESGNEPAKIFQATNEWQEIDEQVLPKGLHVRINLETGKKEAKLLESFAEIDVHSRITTSNYQVIGKDVRQTVADNMESIKKLNDLKEISKSNSIKYKSIKEIKQANVEFTSESILLKEIIVKFSKEEDDKAKLTQLVDMEYYVHSIDLAENLFKIGGFTTLMKELNSTSNVNIKLGVLGVFGAAIQSNLPLKNDLLKSDFLRQIIVLINNSKEISVLKKCLFVLGAFVRNFPLAQKSLFHSYNGVAMLESLLSKDWLLATRITTLLSDLAIEISSAATGSYSNTDAQAVYEQIQFESTIRHSQICSKVVQIVVDSRDRIILNSLLESITGLMVVCQSDFQANRAHLQDIVSLQLKQTDDSAMNSLTDLLNKLKMKDEL